MESLKTVLDDKRSWKEEFRDCHKVPSLPETARPSIIRNRFIFRNTDKHIELVKAKLKILIPGNLYIKFGEP